jgi:hypothetical protein
VNRLDVAFPDSTTMGGLAEIRRVRFGTGLWVDEADVDAALAAIARL